MAAKIKTPLKKNSKGKFKFTWKDIFLYGALLLFLVFLTIGLGDVTKIGQTKDIAISQLVTDINNNKVKEIEVTDTKITVDYKDGKKAQTNKESSASIYEILERAGADPKKTQITVKSQTGMNTWVGVLSAFLPVLLMIAFFYFLFRQARGAQENIFSFGSNKGKQFNKDFPKVTFADVAGVDEAKQELEEVVDFLKHPEKYRAVGARTPKGVLLVGPAGTGKCVTGDTLISTQKGLMEIEDIPRYFYVNPRSHKVYGAGLASFDADKVVSKNKHASHWYDLGEQQTIKIQLAQGFTLEGTPEHPIVVMTTDGMLKFRKLADIEKGDFVAIQFGRNMFGNLNLVDQDTAYLMGLLTGDANMSHASRIGLTNVDDEIITFFKDYVTKRYGGSAITPNGQSYSVSNWDFKKYLYQMGMSYLLSFDKTIPPTILQAPQKIQVAFLQGLFDTDGYVAKKRGEFEYTTVSRKMAQQVQMMMLNMGIVATLSIKGKKENGYARNVYKILLTGESFVAFGKEVGFRISRKQKLVEAHLSRMIRVNTNIDVIPHIGNIVHASWKFISLNKLGNEKLSKTIDKVHRRMRVSRQTLKEYISYASSLSLEIPHIEYLRSLLEAKLFFSPVVAKTFAYSRVYDFTVPQTHSFLGNGFLNHNTLLARAVAGEAQTPFISIAGSEFMEMLVGVGAARVRDLFATAKKTQPAIIFIDEIDAIGRQRGVGIMGGHDEREQTLNQILVEMDGFMPNEQLVVMAATNRPDILDPALVRPGRFDRTVVLPLPDIEGRTSILKIHAKGKPFVKEVDWEKIARRTVGYSGADLENMLNEAAILAARGNRTEITMADLEEAATKVKMGPEKRRIQSEEDKRITAYHEGGHAIVAYAMPHMDPVHRISIVGRGASLGHTLIPPSIDRVHETKTRIMEQLSVMLGGRAAEEMIFNEMTTGAGDDIQKASQLARALVMDYGMSDLGPVNFDATDERSLYEQSQLSDVMKGKIDDEINKIMKKAYALAVETLKKNHKKLDAVAAELLKKETLELDEFDAIMSTGLASGQKGSLGTVMTPEKEVRKAAGTEKKKTTKTPKKAD